MIRREGNGAVPAEAAGSDAGRLRGRWAPPLLAVALLAAAGCWSTAGVAQEENYQRDRRFATQPVEREAEAPDTTGFWFYVRRGETARAREEMERLQRLAPAWSPTEDMRAALDPPSREATPAAATDAASLARQAQDERMRKLAALPASAYGSLAPELLDRAGSGARRLGRADDLLLLGWIALERRELAEAAVLFADAEALDPTIDTGDARRRLLRERVRAAAEGRDEASLAILLAGSDLAIETLRATAWSSLDSGAADDALWRFRQLPPSSARSLGEALSLRAMGRNTAAIDAACSDTLRAKDPTLCRDWLGEALADSYAQGQFPDAIELGRRLEQYGLVSVDAAELVGWSLLELGDPGAAAPYFDTVLTAAPERRDIAGALVTATADDTGARERLAARHPAVRRALDKQRSDLAFARKQFDRVAQLEGIRGAADLTGAAASAVTGRGALEVSAALDWRRREGGTGLSTVELRDTALGATVLWNDWRWTLRVNDSDYEMPTVEPGSWFGSAPVDDAFPGLPGVRDEGWRLEVGRELDGINLYAGIARNLVDQPANETLTGQLSASLFGERSTTALTAYHRYRIDTLLSRVGNLDARAPTPFGGAVSTGMRGLHALRLARDWSAAVSAHVEEIRGENIADNTSWQLRADLALDHAGKRLDYWRTGPFASWWHFDENLSDYSFGHGGYFSPDLFASVGVSSEFLSLEGARWQVKGAVNVAISRIEQDGYLRFPLRGSGPRVPGSSDTGFSGEITLQAQYRLSKRWRVSGYLYHLDAIEFESTAAGLSLHFSPGGRRGVYSRDLPLEAPWVKGFAL